MDRLHEQQEKKEKVKREKIKEVDQNKDTKEQGSHIFSYLFD